MLKAVLLYCFHPLENKILKFKVRLSAKIYANNLKLMHKLSHEDEKFIASHLHHLNVSNLLCYENFSLFELVFEFIFNLFFLFMFAGDDDLLNLIQTEAITLVDSILEESVTVVNNNSSPFNPSPFAQESDLMQHDERQLSHQLSYDENIYDQQQQQQQFQLPLINVNNYSINPSDQAHSDEISDNFAIKSDCDIIVKSPTIESMSGKSFEDVDDEFNSNSSALNDVNVESSLNNNTAANITTSTSPSVRFQPQVVIAEEAVYYSSEDENEDPNFGQVEVQNLYDDIMNESVELLNSSSSASDADDEAQNLIQSALIENVLDSNDSNSDVEEKASNLVDFVLKESFDAVESDKAACNVKPSVSFASEIAAVIDDFDENAAIVRNIPEQKLHRVVRKFEHLSSEVREDDLDSPDLDQLDSLVNKEDISLLQNDFSKISWDESLSPTTGEFGSSTPDNDLQDVLNIPGDTYRHQHNK